jgi:hypothetical protein
MEHINAKFDAILQQKAKEIEEVAASKSKNKKMTSSVNELGYGVKTTLYKINAEQERKLKSSKAYQKKEQTFVV